jgi:hypothetical protein
MELREDKEVKEFLRTKTYETKGVSLLDNYDRIMDTLEKKTNIIPKQFSRSSKSATNTVGIIEMLKNHLLVQNKTKDKGRSANGTASITKAQMKKLLKSTEKLANALKKLKTNYISEMKPAIDRAYTVLTGKMKNEEDDSEMIDDNEMLKLEDVLQLGELTKIRSDASYLLDFVKLIE